MKHAPRLYNCALCHSQTIICSRCDRGQIYCGASCAITARTKSCREAEKRYQRTPGGKLRHAARQRRYRLRQKEKVTDQGSTSTASNALLTSVKNKTKEDVMTFHDGKRYCCFCKQKTLAWYRQGFLQYYNRQANRNLSYLRPP